MADIYTDDGILKASAMSTRIAAGNTFHLPFISAVEVVQEFEKRCANGMQYTTFPNQLSDTEKAKLEEAGYIITGNTVPSNVRYGAGDLYIGFQVALNSRAAQETMQITPNGSGGGGGGGGGTTENTYYALNTGG